MHDVLRFHGVHGSGVALSDDRHVARRGANDFCNAIVFSEKPIKTGQKVCRLARPMWTAEVVVLPKASSAMRKTA